MKKLYLILFAVVITSVNMMAQDKQGDDDGKKTPEEKAELMTKKMTKELGLRADQQAKIKALMLKNEKEKEARKREEKLRKEKMHEELKAILDEAQYQKLKDKKNDKKKGDDKKKGPPPVKPNQPVKPANSDRK